MSEYCIEYSNFNDLMKDEPEVAKELLGKRDKGNWQNSLIHKFECVEDFAYYELTEGWYSDIIPEDFNDAPNPLDYIDLTKLGNALVNNWDESLYFYTSDGEVLSTEYGW